MKKRRLLRPARWTNRPVAFAVTAAASGLGDETRRVEVYARPIVAALEPLGAAPSAALSTANALGVVLAPAGPHELRAVPAAAGVKSLSTFINGSRNVRVDLSDNEVSVLPTSSKEHRNAFSPLTALTVRLPLHDSRELGLAVRKALAASE